MASCNFEKMKDQSDVEALKLALEAQYQDKVDKLALDKQKWLKTQNTALERLKNELEEQAKTNYEAQVKKLEQWTSDYKNQLDFEFQKKEDALEAQFKVRVDEAVERRLQAQQQDQIRQESIVRNRRRLPGELEI